MQTQKPSSAREPHWLGVTEHQQLTRVLAGADSCVDFAIAHTKLLDAISPDPPRYL